MRSTRSGSALLLCLALSVFAILVGFAFLKTASRNVMAGRSDQMIALARNAAQSGLAHATEQILRDYNQSSLVVATGAGDVTIQSPPTFLDGQWRAPFVSLSHPNVLIYTEDSTGALQQSDDVLEENPLIQPYAEVEDLTYMRWHDYYPVAGYGVQSGMSIYDGRGTFIEANHYNSARPDPNTIKPVPVATIRFTDPSAPAPEHDNGLFLDDNFCRLTAGTTAQQRQSARYRLRYAVGVEDLDGHLLANPVAKPNLDYTDPNNTYRKPPAWLEHGAYAMYNMMSGWAECEAGPLRMTHVFLGRGDTTNVDRYSLAGSRQGLPSTFPMMFRSTQKGITQWQLNRSSFWGWFTYDNSSSPLWVGGKLYGFDNSLDPNWPAIAASPSGDQVLTPVGQHWACPYSHALMGPQCSWWNLIFAIGGTRYPQLPNYDSDTDGGRGGQHSLESWDQPRIDLAMVYSLFGRRMEAASTAAKAGWKWYQGPADTPWQINLLTAPPQTISEMIEGYLPPYLKTLHWTQQEVYKRTSITPSPNSHDVFSSTTSTQTGDGAYKTGPINRTASLPGFDILTSQVTSGMSEFPPPTALAPDGVTVVSPCYYQATDPRTPSQQYPGPLCRGDSNVADQGQDDLGQLINVDSGYGGQCPSVGRCSTTENPLLYWPGGDISFTYDCGPNIGDRYLVVQRLDPSAFLYKYSYYWDMVDAMTLAIAYAKAVWVQYPTDMLKPTATGSQVGFSPASLQDPQSCSSIEQIDALFLRELGENFSQPGTPCADNPLIFNQIPGWPATLRVCWTVGGSPVSNTIRSLVANDLIKTASGVASAERGKVMERMLNDWRMSFFGSSPKYGDFRPLDFDGDGHVECSCYDINPAATPTEVTYRTARWKAVEANGRGPAPTPFTTYNPDTGSNPWFSVTGCFFIGKSHFYRIFVRGEVYDNLLKKPAAQQLLESVLTVDPEGPQFPTLGYVSGEQRMLYQRWMESRSNSELPRHLR